MKTLAPILSAFLAAPFAIDCMAAEVRISGRAFAVPDGFQIEQIAGPPLVDRPIEADFDEMGRLYVSDSSGSNEKVRTQLEKKPHRIVRLEDSDRDGRFDRRTVFADKMMFPEGVLWFDGSLYVSAPPSIWKLTDTDGDGVADRREEWFQGKTLTGCANDLHGPYLGRDGWIYWCKGAFAEQRYERPGKPPFVTRAAHIFRSRPDGTGIEPVMTGGMDNPVGLTFLPSGERVFSGTFFQHPGGGKRDGLIHAIYGGVYGKAHNVIESHVRTGDLMPILTHFGPAAPCGLVCYSSEAFGDEFRDNLFTCSFNLRKVIRTVLEPNGASFVPTDSDFLVTEDTDFHPTDVFEDADGSLIVIDTGGWYKLCCPTSQLWKPDVLGAIYRIRRANAAATEDPRGLQLAWKNLPPDELAERLGDRRPAVRDRAIAALAKQGGAAVGAISNVLKSGPNAKARLNAVWALARIEGSDARRAARSALRDTDHSVRNAAAHSAGVWRDQEAVPLLVGQLGSQSEALRRSAAEALGRIGDSRSIGSIIQAAAETRDRILEHSLIYALIEIGGFEATSVFAARAAVPPRSRRAALIALDQMDGRALKPGLVTPLLMSSDPVLKQTAWWIVSHHPDWARSVAGFIQDQLRRGDLDQDEDDNLRRMIGQFAADETVHNLLAIAVGGGERKHVRIRALDAMASANLKDPPHAWITAVANILNAHDDELIAPAVAAAKSWSSLRSDHEILATGLMRIGSDRRIPEAVRLDALAAVPNGLQAVAQGLFEFLCDRVNPDEPVSTRATAAGILAKARLRPDQMNQLTATIQICGPLEVPKLLGAFSKASDDTLGAKLLAALQKSPGLLGVHPDLVKETTAKFSESTRRQLEKLLASRNTDAAEQRAHLDKMAPNLAHGDIRRGQAVFNSAKAACASCHAIGYVGGNVGPDLTRIGQIRNERDLLEAIVYPSASMVRSYEPMIVETVDGEEYSGVLRRDAADGVVLATGPGVEVTIARGDLVEMRPGTISVMPGGLDEQLSTRELADLVAFLKASRR